MAEAVGTGERGKEKGRGESAIENAGYEAEQEEVSDAKS